MGANQPQQQNIPTTLPNECHQYDTKQSDGDTPALEIWGMGSNLFIAIAHRSTLTRKGSTW